MPEEVRDEFLREYAIKRQMHLIRQTPEEIVDNVVRGLEKINQGAFRKESHAHRGRSVGSRTARDIAQPPSAGH